MHQREGEWTSQCRQGPVRVGVWWPVWPMRLKIMALKTSAGGCGHDQWQGTRLFHRLGYPHIGNRAGTIGQRIEGTHPHWTLRSEHMSGPEWDVTISILYHVPYCFDCPAILFNQWRGQSAWFSALGMRFGFLDHVLCFHKWIYSLCNLCEVFLLPLWAIWKHLNGDECFF